MTRVHLIIRGRVQGVWFRASTREEALVLGLSGWARNLADGSVEVVAEGEDDAIDRLIRWCHKGPPGAHVNDIETEQQTATGDLSGFKIH